MSRTSKDSPPLAVGWTHAGVQITLGRYARSYVIRLAGRIIGQHADRQAALAAFERLAETWQDGEAACA